MTMGSQGGNLKQQIANHPSFRAAKSRAEVSERRHLWGSLTVLQSCVKSNHLHPKMQKLIEIVDKHFKESAEDTRIMIFTSFRNSVKYAE